MFLAREFPQARVRGVDSSEALVREAGARVGLDPEGRIAFKVGEAASLPYPDEFFDLVTLVDDRPKVGEVARVLSPGGYLILARTTRPHGLFAESPARVRWRLARRGFEQVETGEAGRGNFFVARLRDPGYSHRSI
jgi:ubiquinone/menaquinone biosynthesis C-methylase UbiE